jgi:hypothetical protein
MVANAGASWAAGKGGRPELPRVAAPAVASPFLENRVHRVGNVWLTVTNYGMIGSFDGELKDQCTGLPAPALEFPGGSGTINLYVGALWIGAVKDGDTLVSVGNDGWQYSIYEMYPKGYPEGAIIQRTTRPVLRAEPNSTCADVPHDDSAVSEQDLIATYYDTLTSASYVVPDAVDSRPHTPLGLRVTQKSFAWSFDYAQDFVLFNYEIENIFDDELSDMYIGVFLDADAFHMSRGPGWTDDFSGFLRFVPSSAGHGVLDTVNTVWTADNDGDPLGSAYNYTSHTSVTGVRVLRAPTPDATFAFNWWISNSNTGYDWGPVKRNSKVQFPHSGLGTPNGDRAKYQVLTNHEFDYDQMEAAVNHEIDGWLPPIEDPVRAANIADGFDTRYLLSTGPFRLAPESTLSVALAVVAGENFHSDPQNFSVYFDPSDPTAFRERLDFTDFALNSQWASWVYDTPGYDTDGDGNSGAYRVIDSDTVYYRGDGVPDFSGPPPPAAPGDLQFETFAGKIVMRWNGRRSETGKDLFSAKADFEGYRVYISRTGLVDDFAMLAQRDLINYVRYRWNVARQRWLAVGEPLSVDSLKTLYDGLVYSIYGYAFHPDSFAVPLVDSALLVVTLDPADPSHLDTSYYHFKPFDANESVDDSFYVATVQRGQEVVRIIRKVYPDAQPGDSLQRNDGRWFFPYYEYEYALSGLQLAEPVFLAVTAFDHGNPAVGLDPLETSPLANMQEVWAINSADVVNTTRPKPGVYPNPYRIADNYNAEGWEDPRQQGLDPERARKVTFTNVPETCVVSIYTLDGDLVRRLDHHESPGSSQASVVVWNLITRNTQAIKTGIYLWTVESRFGVDVGKLVVIK